MSGEIRCPGDPESHGLTFVRYMLNNPKRPALTHTVYVAELARRAVQSIYGAQNGQTSSFALSGKHPDGTPEKGHTHAFFLPTDEDGDGKLDHLTAYCEWGFNDREIRAMAELREIRRVADGTSIEVTMIGAECRHGELGNVEVPLLSSSTRWSSATPFIPSRHHKKRGQKRDNCSPREFGQVALREDILRTGLPVPESIYELDRCRLWDHWKRQPLIESLPWLDFRRVRALGTGRRGLHPGCGFAIEFSEPVTGPLAFGYGCHYGLGLFVPMA
jgi:CRISPR-associated protein Csb2